MEVKPGYKQTDVGVIPEEWEVLDLQQACRETVTYGIVQCGPHIRDGVPYIRVSDMDDPELAVDAMLRTSKSIASKFARSTVEEGDLVYALRGKLGEVRQVRAPLAGSNLTQGTARLSPNERVVSDYFVWAMRDPRAVRQAALEAKGTTFREITLADLRRIKLLVPPLPEQRAIATALSDVDGLLGGLDRLIAKQRDLKQAAMQQLLTGQTRLPGFGPTSSFKEYSFGSIPDDWEVKPLKSVSTMNGRIGWQGLKQEEFTMSPSDPFLITGMNFKDGKIRWDEVYHIPEKRYLEAVAIQLQPNDVLMTKDGTIGKLLYVEYVPHPGRASLNSHLLVFRPIADQYHSKFLFYQLSSPTFAQHIELHKSGTTFFGLSQTATGKYPVILPSAPEQTAIAIVLSDMDLELAALEQRRDKTRALKQAMMQEILTGRTRLV